MPEFSYYFENDIQQLIPSKRYRKEQKKAKQKYPKNQSKKLNGKENSSKLS